MSPPPGRLPRAIRGSSWSYTAQSAYVAYRGIIDAASWYSGLGLRLLRRTP